MEAIRIKEVRQFKQLKKEVFDSAQYLLVNNPIPKNLSQSELQTLLLIDGLCKYLRARNIQPQITVDLEALVKDVQ